MNSGRYFTFFNFFSFAFGSHLSCCRLISGSLLVSSENYLLSFNRHRLVKCTANAYSLVYSLWEKIFYSKGNKILFYFYYELPIVYYLSNGFYLKQTIQVCVTFFCAKNLPWYFHRNKLWEYVKGFVFDLCTGAIFLLLFLHILDRFSWILYFSSFLSENDNLREDFFLK